MEQLGQDVIDSHTSHLAQVSAPQDGDSLTDAPASGIRFLLAAGLCSSLLLMSLPCHRGGSALVSCTEQITAQEIQRFKEGEEGGAAQKPSRELADRNQKATGSKPSSLWLQLQLNQFISPSLYWGIYGLGLTKCSWNF
ncbi:unnamed protein product [Pleuronectes platessa]|uniref:Uncharacterized protein n=1 Tax=Pleuronectes platessa TaxID=8262 RepID=A0A9N7URZ7_PLEPL|nr:unnamed protein product [Pleuronectes platessa]